MIALPPLSSLRSVSRAMLLLALAAFPSLAHAGPPTFLQDPMPVAVEGDVTVQGSVEVVNDMLNVPFATMTSSILAEGIVGSSVGIDIPDGKRFILETIGVFMDVPKGQKVEVHLQTISNGEVIAVYLPVQQTGISSTIDRYVVTMPLKLRIDGDAFSEISVIGGRDDDTGDARVRVTVSGYLVDL